MRSIITMAILCLSLAACSNRDTNSQETTDTAIRPIDTIDAKPDSVDEADTVDYGKRDEDIMKGILDSL